MSESEGGHYRPLLPGDVVAGMTADEAFRLIVGPAQIDGIDAAWRVTDARALERSLREAGLDPRQIDALVQDDIGLERYLQLSKAETECLSSFGLEVTPVRVRRELTGLAMPGYGFSHVDSGYSEEQANHIQASCQNRFTGAYQLAYRARFGPSAAEEEALLVEMANSYLSCVRGTGKQPPFDTVDAARLPGFMTWLGQDETPGCSFTREG